VAALLALLELVVLAVGLRELAVAVLEVCESACKLASRLLDEIALIDMECSWNVGTPCGRAAIWRIAARLGRRRARYRITRVVSGRERFKSRGQPFQSLQKRQFVSLGKTAGRRCHAAPASGHVRSAYGGMRARICISRYASMNPLKHSRISALLSGAVFIDD
jgi:hypothetical protein